MPHFGPRITGKAKFEEQKAAETGGAHFGPRVKGGPSTASPAKSRVLRQVRQAAITQAVAESVDMHEPVTPVDSGVSVEQFHAILGENPTFLDTLLTQELERPDGPRRECLLTARGIAEATDDTETVADIDAALALIVPASETSGDPTGSSATPPEPPPAVDWSTKPWPEIVAEAKRREISTGGKKKTDLIALLNA